MSVRILGVCPGMDWTSMSPNGCWDGLQGAMTGSRSVVRLPWPVLIIHLLWRPFEAIQSNERSQPATFTTVITGTAPPCGPHHTGSFLWLPSQEQLLQQLLWPFDGVCMFSFASVGFFWLLWNPERRVVLTVHEYKRAKIAAGIDPRGEKPMEFCWPIANRTIFHT